MWEQSEKKKYTIKHISRVYASKVYMCIVVVYADVHIWVVYSRVYAGYVRGTIWLEDHDIPPGQNQIK